MRPRAAPTAEETRDRALEEKFGSTISLSVKVLRPMEKYPWEREVWSSEIRVPVKAGVSQENVTAVVEAWVSSMEAGVEVARAFAKLDARDAA